MSTSDCIRLQFDGAGNQGAGLAFNLRKWPLAGHDDFALLPPGACLRIPQKKGLYTNGPIDRRSREVDLDQAVSWGLNDEAHVIYACASSHYCIRFIFHAERVLQSAGSQSLQAYGRLVRDAQFHSSHLQKSGIKGILVPVHYGIWITNTGSWAGKVIMSIPQYCGAHWNDLRHSRMNTEANRVLVGGALEKFHDCGFAHGQLQRTRDLQHVVLDIYDPEVIPDDLWNGGTCCYIVDFSEATANHRCARRLPVLPLDGSIIKFGCEELRHVTYALEFFKRPIKSVMTEALAWHDAYSFDHPDVPNQYVMMEQRAQFFADHDALYPALDLVRDSDGRISTRLTLGFDDETPVDSDRTHSVSPEMITGGVKQLSLDDPEPIIV